MVLYYVHSVYHILVCVTHKLNYNRDKEAVLVYPHWLLRRGIHEEYLHEFFAETYSYPGFKFQSWKAGDIKRVGDEVFLEGFGRSIYDFEKIYIAGAHLHFGAWTAMSGIHFNYMEDACGSFYWHDDFADKTRTTNAEQWNTLTHLGLLDGSGSCIDKIYTNVLPGQEYEDEKIIPYNLLEELKKLDKQNFEALRKVFVPEEEIPEIDCQKMLLLLTDYASRCLVLSMEEQKHFFALIVDYFAPQGEYSLCVKPHPNDVCDYDDVFPGAYIFPSALPVELFMVPNDLSKIMALTAESGGSRMFPNLLYLDVGNFLHQFFLDRAHSYYGFKKIYECLGNDYRCCQISRMPKVLPCFGLEVEEDITGILSDTRETVLLVSEKTDIKILADALLGAGTVLVFDHVPEQIKTLRAIPSMQFLIKSIAVRKFGGEKIQDKFLYIFTRDASAADKIKHLSYEKTLAYAREVARMEAYDEDKMETVALRAVLEATEKRLQEVLDENEELRAELAETESKS